MTAANLWREAVEVYQSPIIAHNGENPDFMITTEKYMLPLKY